MKRKDLNGHKTNQNHECINNQNKNLKAEIERLKIENLVLNNNNLESENRLSHINVINNSRDIIKIVFIGRKRGGGNDKNDEKENSMN